MSITPTTSLSSAPDTAESTLGVLMIVVGGERFGIPSTHVREVVRFRAPTLVPGAPETLPGIISQRGVILPVVNMRALLGLPEIEPTRATRFVVAHYQEIAMALLVDAALDLVAIAESQIDRNAADSRHSRFVRGVATVDELPLALIDQEALVNTLRGED